MTLTATTALVLTAAGGGVALADQGQEPGWSDSDPGWDQGYGPSSDNAAASDGSYSSRPDGYGPYDGSDDYDASASPVVRPAGHAAPAEPATPMNPIDVPPPPGQVRIINLPGHR